MADHSTTTGTLRCVIVTPEATVVDTSTDFVAVPLADGEYGIAVGHSPTIGRLGYGELRIGRGDGERRRYYIDGGFVQVVNNVVNVLTNRAMPSGALDAATANEQLQSAIARPAAGDTALAIRDRLVSQARGQLRVAARSTS